MDWAVFEKEAPGYQMEAIDWLKGYRNTEALQDLLRRFQFSQEEVTAYRLKWAAWLKPKEELKRHRGLH